jgi:hypothetical protein
VAPFAEAEKQAAAECVDFPMSFTLEKEKSENATQFPKQ